MMYQGLIITESLFHPNTQGRGSFQMGATFICSYLRTTSYLMLLPPDILNYMCIIQNSVLSGGDHWFPHGEVLPNSSIPGNFGPYFIPRPNLIPQRDRWYSYELMVKANTPGQRDGRAAFWIDGNLMADFQNVRVRDISTLKIDKIQLGLHAGTCARPTKKWYDNLVVAKSYIGPVSGARPTPTPTPTATPTP